MLRNGADLSLMDSGTKGLELLNHLCAAVTSLSQAVPNCQVHFAKGDTYIDFFKVGLCLACKPGYWAAEVDSLTRLILNCQPIQNCQITSDERNSWMNACQSCASRHAWDYDDKARLIKFERCVPSPDVSCLVFDFANKQCRMCHKDFSLDGNGKCQSTALSANCLEFGAPVFLLDGSEPTSFYRDGTFVKYFLAQSENLFGCKRCKSGFNLFTGAGKICVSDIIIRGQMLPNCQLHAISGTGETECYSCNETFILLNDSSGCIPGSEVDGNCKRAIRLSANTFGCFECNPGYLPNSKFHCDREGDLCAEVVKDDPVKGTFCKFCRAGHRLVNGGCDAIPPGDPCVQYNEFEDCIQCREPGKIPHHYINQYHKKLILCVTYSPPNSNGDPQLASVQNFIRYSHAEHQLEFEPALCPENYYRLPLVPSDAHDHIQCIQYPVMPHCLKYNMGAFCEACAKFHGPDRNGNCVKDAISGCEDYDSAEKCLKCKEGYFSFGGGSSCNKYTVANCKVLDENFNRCLECRGGFWKNLDGGCSGYTVEFCEQVSKEEDKCLKCRASHFLNQKGQCQELTFKKHCLEYFENRDECKECSPNFYLSALNACLPNPSGIPNCVEYQKEDSCSACKPHFYIFLNSCRPVSNPVPNCARYSDNGFCAKCDRGFFLKNVFACDPVSEQSCREWTDAYNCLSCHERMIMVYEGGFAKCRASAISQCLEPSFDFTSNSIICRKCTSGYFIDASSTCVRSATIIPNCDEYASDGVCRVCQKGFILTSDKARCMLGIEEAGEFCDIAEYLPRPVCKICDYGYFLDDAGACVACRAEGCAICELDSNSSQTCKLCRSGFYMNSELNCISLGSPVPTPTWVAKMQVLWAFLLWCLIL